MKTEEQHMHCQCCGRTILAHTGRIAHHGYTRPEPWYQTASCMGARALPWEADRTKLGDQIKYLKLAITRETVYLSNVAAEVEPVTWSWKVYRGFSMKDEVMTIQITRSNFAALKEKHSTTFMTNSIYDFDTIKKRKVQSLQRNLEGMKMALGESEKRYATWKRTHRFIPPSNAESVGHSRLTKPGSRKGQWVPL